MIIPRFPLRLLSMLIFGFGFSLQSNADMVVIAHVDVPNIDSQTLARIYTGKVIEVNGIHIEPFNLSSGQPERTQFLQQILGRTDDNYIGYWIVRKSIGKGTAPPELKTQQELIETIRNTPGGIGYIDRKQVPDDVKVLSIVK
jgi:ABC-type phosphate transport system substrate-binding protein